MLGTQVDTLIIIFILQNPIETSLMNIYTIWICPAQPLREQIVVIYDDMI